MKGKWSCSAMKHSSNINTKSLISWRNEKIFWLKNKLSWNRATLTQAYRHWARTRKPEIKNARRNYKKNAGKERQNLKA